MQAVLQWQRRGQGGGGGGNACHSGSSGVGTPQRHANRNAAIQISALPHLVVRRGQVGRPRALGGPPELSFAHVIQLFRCGRHDRKSDDYISYD